MPKLGNVQTKISCIFETIIVEEKSSKRSGQSYKVVASDQLRESAVSAGITQDAAPTEKLDGTCAYVQTFNDKPWLWARHDRKPNKAADKRFKKYENARRVWVVNGSPEGTMPTFHWNVQSDFKDVPEHWIPATGVDLVDGLPQPDVSGHIPGWVPVDPKARQHCWHLSTVDLDLGIALVLRPAVAANDLDTQLQSNLDLESANAVDLPSEISTHRDMKLELSVTSLEELLGSTMELIGTNINGNPYGLGTKQQPIHVLVRHGHIPFSVPPPADYARLRQWLSEADDGQVEGVVWHCRDGQLFKLHRHHQELKWPVEKPRLQRFPVTVRADIGQYHKDLASTSLFMLLGPLNGQTFDSLAQIMP